MIPTPDISLPRRTWTSAGNAEGGACADRVLTVAEAADMLMVPQAHLIGMLRGNEIPSQEFEGQLRVKESDIRVFLAELKKRQDSLMDNLDAESQAVEEAA